MIFSAKSTAEVCLRTIATAGARRGLVLSYQDDFEELQELALGADADADAGADAEISGG